MKKLLSILILSLLSLVCVRAQEDNFRSRYEDFRKQAQTSYDSFRRQCNQEYAEFLKQAWTYFKMGPVMEKPVEEDVPPVVIEEDRDKVPIENNELPYDEVVPVPEEVPQPQPVEPIQETPVIDNTGFSFDFFGTPLKIRVDDANKFVLRSVAPDYVGLAWEKLSGQAYDNMLYDCLAIRDTYKLCDWAYLMMLLNFSAEFLQTEQEAILLTAFLYCQSGYKMRLGMTEDQLCLLFGTRHQIYGAGCYEIDGSFFYPLNCEAKEMQIADTSFPEEKEMSLAMSELPLFARNNTAARSFEAKGYKTTASCSVNSNLLAFFECYPTSQLDNNPMTRWALYANTPLDQSIKDQLYPGLRAAIDGQPRPKALDILLDFVQTAFEYEYDDKVWGGDRALFAEESLYYPYCDCEDRSILFSRLVRDLLGLDVILVYYPGHLATAVKLPELIEGDYLSLNEENYLVCDPTCIGAPIGMTMPDMDNKTAKVILLKR